MFRDGSHIVQRFYDIYDLTSIRERWNDGAPSLSRTGLISIPIMAIRLLTENA